MMARMKSENISIDDARRYYLEGMTIQDRMYVLEDVNRLATLSGHRGEMAIKKQERMVAYIFERRKHDVALWMDLNVI